MKTLPANRPSRPLISQLQNNATLWIGHLKPLSQQCMGGQTFCSPADGIIDNIQVLATAVTQPGNITLTLHEFDPVNHTWGPVIGSSNFTVENSLNGNWISFELASVQLRRDAHYAFRLQSDDGLIGLGEAVHTRQHPFAFGEAWNANGQADAGNYLRYFSLAFKVEMCA